MIEREIDIATTEGSMPCFVVHPDEGGPYPVILVFMDALGIREELRDMSRRFASAGYYAMLANLYYRDGGLSFDPTAPADHEAVIADVLAKRPAPGRLEHHAGALHGFTFPERYCYHKRAAERVWSRLFALFRRTIEAPKPTTEG